MASGSFSEAMRVSVVLAAARFAGCGDGFGVENDTVADERLCVLGLAVAEADGTGVSRPAIGVCAGEVTTR